MRFLAPRHDFWAATDRCAEAFPAVCTCPEPASRNGVSLARDSGLLSKTSITRSTLPACRFDPIPNCSPTRSNHDSRPHWLSRIRGRSPSRFRCRIAARNSLAVTGLRSPSGLASFRIDVLTASGLGGSPSFTVRSPFAPRLRSFFIIPACGSSFAARCRSRGLLFLLTSWNHPDDAPKRILSQ